MFSPIPSVSNLMTEKNLKVLRHELENVFLHFNGVQTPLNEKHEINSECQLFANCLGQVVGDRWH